MSKNKRKQAEAAEAPPRDVPDADSAEALADAAAAQEPPPEVDPFEQLRDEVDAAKDLALRHQAELDNYRKRAARELQDVRRYANLPLMRELLPVLDNLDRAIEAAEKNHDTASLLEGVKIVADQLKGVLAQHHCQPIESLGQPFDPNLHEAILQQPSDEHAPGSVSMETVVGFQLHDRVVRPSQVIVAAKKEEAAPEAAPSEEPPQ